MMKPREFWICDSGFSEWPVTPEKPTDKHHPTMHMGEELADCDCTSCVDWTHVREVLPNEPDYKALAQELVKALKYPETRPPTSSISVQGKIDDTLSMLGEWIAVAIPAIDNARKAGIE